MRTPIIICHCHVFKSGGDVSPALVLRQCETHLVCLSCSAESATEALSLALHSVPRVFHLALRLCETPPSPLAPDPVGIENCKQLFSPLLAFTTQKIATRSTHIISAKRVAFFWVVNATRNEKSCLQFLIPTAVFHMLLKQCETHSQRVSLAPPRERLKLSLLHSIVFHIALR